MFPRFELSTYVGAAISPDSPDYEGRTLTVEWLGFQLYLCFGRSTPLGEP
jgi:hypothetical protein